MLGTDLFARDGGHRRADGAHGLSIDRHAARLRRGVHPRVRARAADADRAPQSGARAGVRSCRRSTTRRDSSIR